MEQTNTNVISVPKQKLEWRVEQGKALAQHNKDQREEYKKLRGERNDSWNISYSSVIGSVGLILSIINLVYARKNRCECDYHKD